MLSKEEFCKNPQALPPHLYSLYWEICKEEETSPKSPDIVEDICMKDSPKKDRGIYPEEKIGEYFQISPREKQPPSKSSEKVSDNEAYIPDRNQGEFSMWFWIVIMIAVIFLFTTSLSQI